MRVIMTGGGTGGHIYPAIAIADRIKERTLDSEILFVGTEKGLEKDLVPANGYEIRFITVSGINRRKPLKNFKVLKEYQEGKKQAKRIIEEFKPDIVIGTGGYVCGPIVKIAAKMGIKTCIHEQNAIPGLTNKILEGFVDTVFLGFEDASSAFKKPEKHVVSGNPVRDKFFKARKHTSREKLGIDQDKFVVLAFGGSQGAGKINKAMLDVVENYSGDEGVQVYFATGKRYYEPVMCELEEKSIKLADNIEIMEYINQMELYVSAADVIISRSGALAVSEIAVCGTPSILIPSPNVAGNHQMYNAKVLSDKGGAVLLEEENLSGDRLIAEIETLKKDREKLQQMAVKAKECAPLDASDIIYYHIING